ncbi:hypothetical protein M6B38_385840 [Iris pallida]|uniref:Uncharacterized protein n=1 Tax=Iris pallida TaxID=29817 RepID=A0AAX6EHQ1_IRIPA|nr:hypothetical protein M6B38_108490 [Iris pallida]KAJ6822936.1 hypothetical protein M6B38_385840 [Iris pallida]
MAVALARSTRNSSAFEASRNSRGQHHLREDTENEEAHMNRGGALGLQWRTDQGSSTEMARSKLDPAVANDGELVAARTPVRAQRTRGGARPRGQRGKRKSKIVERKTVCTV